MENWEDRKQLFDLLERIARSLEFIAGYIDEKGLK